MRTPSSSEVSEVATGFELKREWFIRAKVLYSQIVRRVFAERRHTLLMRLEHAACGGRELGQRRRRTGRPLDQIAAAIGAAPAQAVGRAIGAEGAFEGADQRVGCAVGQILVAAFAIGPELQHGNPRQFGRRQCGR